MAIFFESMKLILVAFVLLLALMTSAQCQQTAGVWVENYEYRHNYTDIGMAFFLPVSGADVTWMAMLGSPRVFLEFDFNREHYSIEIRAEGSDLSAKDIAIEGNLEKLWLGGQEGIISEHSPLMIRSETMGDGIKWVVSGRLVMLGNMKTRSIAAFDNEADGDIDVVIEATGGGKVDASLLENISGSTRTYPVEVDWL